MVERAGGRVGRGRPNSGGRFGAFRVRVWSGLSGQGLRFRPLSEDYDSYKNVIQLFMGGSRGSPQEVEVLLKQTQNKGQNGFMNEVAKPARQKCDYAIVL